MEKLPNVFYAERGPFIWALHENKNKMNGWGEPIELVPKSRYDTAVAALKKIKENNLSGGDCKAFADMALKELGE